MSSDSQPSVFLNFVPHTTRPGFLGPEENARLLDYTLRSAGEFRESTVGDKKLDRRKRISSTFIPEKAIKQRFREQVSAQLDDVMKELKVPAFEPSGLEVQLAAHGEGAFFLRHIDTQVGNGSHPNETRALSFVYYYCQEPARFTGGVLRIHSLAGRGQPGSFVDITPQNDLLAVFPSWLPHEVLPVTTQDSDFSSNRFAVNCWVHK